MISSKAGSVSTASKFKVSLIQINTGTARVSRDFDTLNETVKRIVSSMVSAETSLIDARDVYNGNLVQRL